MNFPGTPRRGNDLSLKGNAAFHSLHRFFDTFSASASVRGLQRTFLAAVKDAAKTAKLPSVEYLRAVYEDAVSFVEKNVSEGGGRDASVALQQDLYRELEDLISAKNDTRHHFMVVVPVADRPVMLRKCLGSLLEQCRLYGYGGTSPGRGGTPVYRKISVFIVDDSGDETNRRKIREIGEEIRSSGVRTYYIGHEEQTKALKQVPAELLGTLSGPLGRFSGSVSPHKGAAVSRNIAFLYLNAVVKKLNENVLVHFIDSDEEFRIAVERPEGREDIHFINYFYWLDRIFRNSGVEVLTGKVVGDPPVSPSVMINTFLDDLILFLDTLSGADASQQCTFHSALTGEKYSAEYHDMGSLFGYHFRTSPKKYHCGMRGPHTVKDCFEDLARKAMGFFYGLHPTRTQFYIHRGSFIETERARTVYTGNYVFRAEGFRHFIPFANLNLRMAGPTLGRILRGTLKEKFVSVNLPLLHNRTLGEDYENEFRSGVIAGGREIDLSKEYLRQFWGDVMLFSVEALSDRGYPEEKLPEDAISGVVIEVQEKLLGLYKEKQAQTAAKVSIVSDSLGDPDRWWNKIPGTGESLDNLRSFCTAVDNNLGERSSFPGRVSAQIADGTYLRRMTDAINSFHEDELLWNGLLKTGIKVEFPQHKT
jgi:glycosyltransferase involved in cell wall biosynthesis